MNEQVQELARLDSANAGRLRKLHAALFRSSFMNEYVKSNISKKDLIWGCRSAAAANTKLSLCEEQ